MHTYMFTLTYNVGWKTNFIRKCVVSINSTDADNDSALAAKDPHLALGTLVVCCCNVSLDSISRANSQSSYI